MCAEPERARPVAEGGDDDAGRQAVGSREVFDAARFGVELIETAPRRDVDAAVEVFGNNFSAVGGKPCAVV